MPPLRECLAAALLSLLLSLWAESLRAEDASLSKRLVARAAEVQALEAQLEARERRIRALQGRQRRIKAALGENRDQTSLLGEALLRLSRAPGAPLLAVPDEDRRRWRGAMLLRHMLPRLRHDAGAISGRLEQMRDLAKKRRREKRAMEKALAKAKKLYASLERLQRRRARQRGVDPAIAARSPLLKGGSAQDLAKEASRLLPAPSLEEALSLALPTSAPIARIFGERRRSGDQSEGLAFQTREGAQITAPATGSVIHAGPLQGPLRHFKKVLILSVGGGYHIVMAGLAQITGAVGQRLHRGEPVGRMGGSSRPRLYMELLDRGTPIDPFPFLRRGKKRGSGEFRPIIPRANP